MLLGIGAYWDPLAWNQGIDRRKPVRQMREYIEVTRRLLALETVTYEGELVAVRDLRLDLGHGVARIPKQVPIYVGATGPQMLALSGELADGVMLNGFTSLTYLADALGHIERGARRTGRRVDDLDLPQTIVVAMDENEEKALEVATRMTTMYLGQQPHIALASGVDRDLLDSVRETMGGWPPRDGGIEAAMPLVPVAVVRSLTAAGTPEQCIEQVAAYSVRPNIYPALLIRRTTRRSSRRSHPARLPAARPRTLQPHPRCPERPVGSLRILGRSAVCILAAAISFACAGSSQDPASDERLSALEAKTRSLEESIEALASENAALRDELAILAERTGPGEAREDAASASEPEGVADSGEGQEKQPVIKEDGPAHTQERLDDLDARVRDIEDLASTVEWAILAVEQWVKGQTSRCRCWRARFWKGPSGWRRIPEARSTTSTTPNERTLLFC